MTTNEEESRVKGAPCHFPFVYKNITYNDCIKVDHKAYWCFTKINDTTGLLRGTTAKRKYLGKWGNCDSSCPKGN